MNAEIVDAVVVGAGTNGLVAANLLADAGWDVLLIEATARPGGAVQTAELTAPGFRNDLCSAFYPLGVASPVLAELDLESHGLEWRSSPAVLAHVLPDDSCAVVWRDPDQTAASLAAFVQEDGDAWVREFAYWQRIREDLLEALLRPFPPVRPTMRLLGKLRTADAIRLVRRMALPVRRLAEEQFTGEGARLLYAGSALHTDLSPESAGSALFGWILAMLAQDLGFPVPAGGAGSLTDALVRRLTSKGGRLVCGRPVTRVLVAGGRAFGVHDASGGLVRVRNAVLTDVPAPTLYLDLVGAEHLPQRFVDDLTNFHWDNATIKVDWALSSPIPWTAKDVATAGTVHLGVDLAGLTGYGADLACARVPRDPFLVLGQMSTADPSRSPAGTETVWAYTHVPHETDWTTDKLRRHADRIQAILERHAPGFGERVLARSVHGPGDLQGHNPSLVGGAINAGTTALHQELVFRPVPGLARADTPIDRLFLASASAHPGGAVHGAPGANAARAALLRAGHAGALYGSVIGLAHRVLHGSG